MNTKIFKTSVFAALALTVTFNSCKKEEDKTYVVNVVVVGNGYVTGMGEYPKESIVKLTAIPDAGYVFAGWKDGKTLNPLAFSITENRFDTAYFTIAEGTANGNEWVDLGLPSRTLWAKENLGCSDNDEFGAMFAFGETTPKDEYTTYNYKYGELQSITKYQTPVTNNAVYDGTGIWYDSNMNFIGDGISHLEPEDNAAYVNWGGNWGIPLRIHVYELIENCSCIWVRNYKGSSQSGIIFKSKINGNELFMPIGGYWINDLHTTREAESFGLADLDAFSEQGGEYKEYERYPYSLNGISMRYIGKKIRPVCSNSNDLNGHDAVDLGMPSGILWATCNVGANNPEENGDDFAWGETQPKAEYTWETYKYVTDGSSDWTDINKYTIDDGYYWSYYKGKKFIGDSLTTLEAEDDAATVMLGNNWHIPTMEQWKELLDNCFWYKSSYGFTAYAAKSNADKGRIIVLDKLPDSYTDSDLHIDFSFGLYRTCNTGFSVTVPAYYRDIISIYDDYFKKYEGEYIRPVYQSE